MRIESGLKSSLFCLISTFSEHHTQIELPGKLAATPTKLEVLLQQKLVNDTLSTCRHQREEEILVARCTFVCKLIWIEALTEVSAEALVREEWKQDERS